MAEEGDREVGSDKPDFRVYWLYRNLIFQDVPAARGRANTSKVGDQPQSESGSVPHR